MSPGASENPSRAAEYWGVLNRLREAAELCYAATRELHRRRGTLTLQIVTAVLVIAGAGWLLALAVFAARGGDIVTAGDGASGPWAWNLLAIVMLSLPGAAFVGFGVRAAIGTRRHAQEAAHYDSRRDERVKWRRVFEDLGSAWRGTVTEDGIASAMRFLAAHHPDSAPVILLHHQAGNDEDRITLTARVQGAPLLVQFIDNSRHGQHVRPPALIVLVAAPTGVDSARLAATAAYRALAQRGFVIGVTSASVYVIHPGPLEPCDRNGLSAIVRSVVDLCHSASGPADGSLTRVEPVAVAPLVDADEADFEAVANAFLAALRDHDGLAALALAHPMLFPRGPREPSPDAIDRVVTAAAARPLRWERASLTSAGGNVRRGVHAQFAHHPPAEAHLHLAKVGDRWTVLGYAVGIEQILGVEFSEPSD